MDEAPAIEGLRRTEARLRAYAEERGLVLRTDPVYPGAPPPSEQRGPIRHAVWSLAGRFPGGAVGRLRHQAVYGRMPGGGSGGGGQHTLFVSRLPESVGYVPLLNLRPAGAAAGLFAWAGDSRPRDTVEFESVELGRRYLIEVARGQDRAWLLQLFPPSFIDWLASSTPPDFAFRLDAGVLHCECPEWRGQATSLSGEVEPEYLDLLSAAAGRVASRIRDEVLEEIGTPGQASPDSMVAAAERAAAPKHGFLLRTLLRVVGAGDAESGVAAFAAEHGLEVEQPVRFHARHIALPLPGTATDVAAGALPGGGPEGELAWMTFSSIVDVERNLLGVLADAGTPLPTCWIDDEDVGLPGFADHLGAATTAFLAERGLGLSTAGSTLCLYRSSGAPGAWFSREQAVELCGAASELRELLRAQTSAG